MARKGSSKATSKAIAKLASSLLRSSPSRRVRRVAASTLSQAARRRSR